MIDMLVADCICPPPPANLSRHWAAASVVLGTKQSMSNHADCAEDEADEDDGAETNGADEAEGTSAIRRSPEAAAAAVAFAVPLPLFASSPSVYLSAPRRT